LQEDTGNIRSGTMPAVNRYGPTGNTKKAVGEAMYVIRLVCNKVSINQRTNRKYRSVVSPLIWGQFGYSSASCRQLIRGCRCQSLN
jgi:hypothetical protein